MNNKGFAVSGVLYIVLLLFISIMTMLLFTLQNRKSLLDVIKNDTYDALNKQTFYTYDNGYEFYFNPEINKACSEEAYEANLARYKSTYSVDSPTGLKTGCLKWHVFNDDKYNSKVTAIIDHNTTPLVKWNSANTNTEMNEIFTALVADTTTWNPSLNARIISADEIAKIVGYNDFDSSLTNYTDWFYLDTLNKTYSSTAQGDSKYAWLFNYLKDATSRGANYDDNNQYTGTSTNYLYGYWTSSKANGSNSNVWYVENTGKLLNDMASTGSAYGLRPVIEVDKKHLRTNKCPYDAGQIWTFDYTGSYQEFIAPCSGTYKIELWGASGGSYESKFGKGGYTAGEINLHDTDLLYVYVGEKGEDGTNETNKTPKASWNGGGAGSDTSDTEHPLPDQVTCHVSGSGGGATDIRLVPTSSREIWNDIDSLKSRIMVAAGGGGGAGGTTSGGDGGGLNGIKSENSNGSWNGAVGVTGGTQIAGGLSSELGITSNGGILAGNNGTFGIGGDSVSYNHPGGGGGSGYYGGAAGGSGYHSAFGSNGAGGSSYISGHTGCVAILSKDSLNSRKGADGTTVCSLNTVDPICSRHYSNYVFENTVMVDGQGYSWTTVKGSKTDMPTYDGEGTMIGNIGSGYAKITYLGD